MKAVSRGRIAIYCRYISMFEEAPSNSAAMLQSIVSHFKLLHLAFICVVSQTTQQRAGVWEAECMGINHHRKDTQSTSKR